ncbi:hypothetical protein BC834DRAFT_272023 [Gloeopeniophorella convolvens]|nr:hypothetical protein BC834DRAFT_272023 [Gloeopeniophorella convolvens]
MRVYGLYSPNKRLFFILIAGCALEIAAMVILIAITMSHISRLPVVSTPTGCHYSGLFSLSALLWLPALVFEPVLCLFVVWKAWGDDILRWFAPHASTRSKTILTSSKAPPIVKAMARDSVIYFIAIFLELLANTIIWSHFNQYINVIMPWTCALPSILGSRLFIHMRQLMLHANEGIDEDVSTIALDTGIPGATSWSTDAPTSNTREHDDTV